MEERDHEAQVRWQGRTIDQVSFLSNLTLGLSAAASGFAADLLLDPETTICGTSRTVLVVGTAFHLMAVLMGLLLAWNRLVDFRKTALTAARRRRRRRLRIVTKRLRVATRALGRNTWWMLRAQTIVFAIGAAAFVASVAIHIGR